MQLDSQRPTSAEIGPSKSANLRRKVFKSPNRLAADLIRLGKITSFQANVLYGNLPIPLTIGPFRITESLESWLGTHWLKAIDTSRPKRP